MLYRHAFLENFIVCWPVITPISSFSYKNPEFLPSALCCCPCLSGVDFPVLLNGKNGQISWPRFMILGLPLLLYWKISLKHDRNLRTASCCSVTQSCPTLPPHGLQHTRLPCPSLSTEAYSNSCPSSQRCHPTISSAVTCFCLQSFPASGSFPMLALRIRWPKYLTLHCPIWFRFHS